MRKNKSYHSKHNTHLKSEPLPKQSPPLYYQGDGYDKLPLYQRWLRKQGWLWWLLGVPPPKKFFKILKKAMFNLD
jgi:hypothetical protein